MLTNGFVFTRLLRPGWLVLVWCILCFTHGVYAATFTSVTSGDWDDGATWGNASPGVSGTDFPANADDAIIASGHTVALTQNEVVNDLTVNTNATLNNSTFRINVDGNYTVNGTHAGTGRIRLRGIGTTIGGTGSVTSTGSFQLHTGSKIIQASADLTVSGRIRIFSGITVTNSGSITALNRLSGVDASAVWENAANATLTVHNQLMNNGGTLTATAAGNTVAYVRTGTGNQTIKNPSGSTYHNLIIDGDNNNSRKRPEADIIINGDLTIDGSTFDVSSSNFQVTLRGNWNQSGNFNERDGTVVMAGTSTQNINGTTTFDNLTISNASGVVLGTSTVQLEGTLSITSGTFETNGVLQLVSNASGSARIGEITGGGISGNLLVQRYIANAATEWRFLTSPVSGRTLNDWNDDVTTTGFTGSDFPNFPVASAPFVSIYTYNEAVQGGIDDGFEVPGNITDAIGVGEGFFVYIGPTPLTVDVTGPANTGTLALPVTFTSTGDVTADGWNLVGNPHVSDVDWSGFTRSGMENRFWVWSPASGNYAVWDESSGIGTLGANGDIALGQAFWVHATSTPSLSIPESAKTTGAPEFFKTASDPAMTIRMTAAGMDHYDEAILRVADNATLNY
ncbi:MAG: hypothetical protein AAGB22_03195, partial [Bacteroidota bacterium]